jgi:hypothetical protein
LPVVVGVSVTGYPHCIVVCAIVHHRIARPRTLPPHRLQGTPLLGEAHRDQSDPDRNDNTQTQRSKATQKATTSSGPTRQAEKTTHKATWRNDGNSNSNGPHIPSKWAAHAGSIETKAQHINTLEIPITQHAYQEFTPGNSKMELRKRQPRPWC